jgi:diguanylate cyclase (GGDEF)-like protein
MDSYFACNKELNLLNPEAHRIFRVLVEEIKIGIFMADSHNQIFYGNQAFKNFINFIDRGSFSGQNWTHLLFPDIHTRTAFLAELDKHGSIKDHEINLAASPQKNPSMLMSVNFICNDQQQRIGIHGFIINIAERRILEEELLKKHQKLEQILDFYNALSKISESEDLSKFIVEQASAILHAKRCSLMLIDPAKNELFIKAAFGLDTNIIKNTRVKIGDPISGLLVLQSNPMLVENIETFDLCKRKNGEHYAQPFFMSAPLVAHHKVMGIINISDGEIPFNTLDLKVLEAVAQHAAVNIYKVNTLNNLSHQALTDPLTELWNYRSFINKIDEEIARSFRYNNPLSIMIIDVDHFKNYNDAKGHPKGDELLIQLAKMFKKNLRNTEYICRHGGDEFCVILPQTEMSQAAVAAEKIREMAIAEFAQTGITLSIGVAQYQKNLTRDFLINMADSALYQAKRAGRNRVFMSRVPLAQIQPPTPPHAEGH